MLADLCHYQRRFQCVLNRRVCDCQIEWLVHHVGVLCATIIGHLDGPFTQWRPV